LGYDNYWHWLLSWHVNYESYWQYLGFDSYEDYQDWVWGEYDSYGHWFWSIYYGTPSYWAYLGYDSYADYQDQVWGSHRHYWDWLGGHTGYWDYICMTYWSIDGCSSYWDYWSNYKLKQAEWWAPYDSYNDWYWNVYYGADHYWDWLGDFDHYWDWLGHASYWDYVSWMAFGTAAVGFEPFECDGADVDNNGSIDILDVVTIVNFIVEGEDQEAVDGCVYGDYDESGSTDVLDIVAIVGVILEG